IPPDVSSLQELKASMLMSPFPPDRLFLHRKKALKDSVGVKNLRLSITPGFKSARIDEPNWTVY
ncbi:MAG: hypothetical protein K2Z81_04955, partial [Cyanobacteria bacterium]|nr:hypothetical protein [Cyanobacteriota bacterium]